METLHCDNPECDSQILKKYVHFVAKKAMDISGISESNLRRFLECGWLTSFQDIYHLDRHRKEIISLEGYGAKSYEKLWAAVNESRNTDFIHYLTAMDIPDWEDWEIEGARQSLVNSLRTMEDSAGSMEDFVMGQAAAGSDETIPGLIAALAEVTPERVRAAAKSVKPDTIYFLKGKEGCA